MSDKIFLIKWAPMVYGRYWKKNLARHFSYNIRTITNWMNGASSMPRVVALLLEIYCRYGYRYDAEKNIVTQERKNKHGQRL